MALTNVQRQKNWRNSKIGLPPAFASSKPAPGEVDERIKRHVGNFEFATAQDATGKYYKSECWSCMDLLAIYEGTNILDKETDDEDESVEGKKKRAKKKENRPNPSQQKIEIKAIEYNGIKLEPNCDPDFRKLKEVDEVVSFQRWLDLRDKARKDLLWLGRLLGFGLFHSVHQYICDKFVQKNFDGMFFPEFTMDDLHDMFRAQKRFANDGVTPCREMVLLESRGGYKSTIDGIDAISWLINVPDVRIMIITGVKSLAKKFARQIKKNFYLAVKAKPTAFQLLFPEYILTGVDGRSESPMDCPAAFFNQKEHNLWVTSIESSNTGDHCDVRKADDVVTPKNSADKELREALKFDFDGTYDVLDPWGFSDVCGTRYFTDDWYGTRALPNEETKEVAPYLFSCRGCWTLSPQDEAEYKAGKLTIAQILNERRAVLTFPYKLSWAELRSTYNKKGERSFKNQQLNEATDPNVDELYINQFNIEVLRAHSYPRAGAPREMEIIQCWDFAYSERKTSDFSAGATIGIYQDKNKQLALVVLEVIFDKWKGSELASNMLSFYEKWRPTRAYIEEANGLDFLMGNIKNLAQLHGSDMTQVIRRRPMSVKPNAKRARIRDLEFLLGHDRLWFVNGPWIDETFKQLTQYTGSKSTTYRKDDIPDCLSFATEHLPPTALMHNPDPKEVEKEHERMMAKANKSAMYNRMFGTSPLVPALRASEWVRNQRGGSSMPPVAQEDPNAKVNPFYAMLAKILPSGMRL